MISKIGSNNYNVNFQSRVHISNNAAEIIGNNLNFLNLLKSEIHTSKLRKNKEANDVFITAFQDFFGKGIKLLVRTEDNLSGTCNYHFKLDKNIKFNLLEMYNQAKNNLKKLK